MGRVLLWSSARSADEVLADCVSSGIIDPVAAPTLELFVDFSEAPVVGQSGTAATIAYQNGARLAIMMPALMLDGMCWADVGAGPQLDFAGDAPFTINGWFNALAYGAAGTGTVVSRALPGAAQYCVGYTASGWGTGYLTFTRGASSIRSADLPGDTWFHFAASFDAANSALYLYVNGNLQSSLIVADPMLAQPVTKTVKNGRVRLSYHAPAGDVLLYEGDANAVTDCQLWWIGFTATIILGLIDIVFQLHTGTTASTAVTTRIYNLMVRNPQVVDSMFVLIALYSRSASPESLALQALKVVGEVWKAGLLWSVCKIALSMLTWWGIGAAITRIVVWICGAEVAAAATLAQVIKWEGQIAYQLSSYTTSCPVE